MDVASEALIVQRIMIVVVLVWLSSWEVGVAGPHELIKALVASMKVVGT